MTQIAPKPASDQRAAPRMRTLIAAKISFNNGQSTLDCIIRNLSDTGAKLIVSAAIALPDGFDLLIPQKSVTRRVRTVWRRVRRWASALTRTHPGPRAAIPMRLP